MDTLRGIAGERADIEMDTVTGVAGEGADNASEIGESYATGTTKKLSQVKLLRSTLLNGFFT